MFKKIYIPVLIVILAAGCRKDPMLVAPTDVYPTNGYPKTIGDLQSVLVPAYSNFRSVGLWGFELMPKVLANSTHTANAVYGGDQAWNEMTNNNLSISNNYVSRVWASLYTGVKNCNVVLNAADFFEENYAGENDKAAIDRIRGQAYFLRAFYYFQLECFYGEAYIKAGGANGDKKGVPLYGKFPADLESTQIGRSTTRETWDLIEGDLQKAADLLEDANWTGNDQGRVTEWAAKALLGKAYVFTEDWANAKTVLLDVIQNSGKALMPYDKYKDSFTGNSASEFNEESIFELNIDGDNKGNYGPWGNTPNATNLPGVVWAPWALGGNGTEADGFPLGYDNESIHDQNVKRYGYPLGYYNIVDNPDFDASKGASYRNPERVMDPAYKTAALAVRENKTADPRLFVSTLQPWLDSVRFDGANWAPVSKPRYLIGQQQYGFSFRKGANILWNLNSNPAQPNNIYFIRLADVYLLYAEASKGSGDNTTAVEYLNKVKRRAYGYPVDAPSPVDYASLTSTTVAIGDPVLGTNPLYYERWAELFNEGHWWFDVCRWKIGPSEAAYYGTALNVGGAPFAFNESKSYSWPIPLAEFNSNAAIAGQQNPGY
ncbi:MAG: RagB/SusD family nutrient uptake outer membrane protein [Sphingobacteriaceae bacterium]|nr:MAG: RagB/SusD family nutrient uptake outer membrane protein [Sphingobacteriaceae bacterium]